MPRYPTTPTTPGTPSDGGQVSDIDGEPAISLQGRVNIAYGIPLEMHELDVDHVTSIGWLRCQARNWLRSKEPRVEVSMTQISVVYNKKRCLRDYTKVYDIAICTEGEPPQFIVEVDTPDLRSVHRRRARSAPVGREPFQFF